MTTSRWGLFGALLALVACSNQEAGQSTFVEQPFVATAVDQPNLIAEQEEARRLRAEILAGQQERRTLAAEGDARLVASLEAAIAEADARSAVTDAPTGPVLMPSILPEAEQQPAAPTVAEATPEPTAPLTPVTPEGSGQITDNSFSTVVERETIESDAERLARLRQSNVVLEAAPLPERNDGVNLAAFAMSTTHRIGQRIYRRTGERSSTAAARQCRRFGNPDAAQRAFLASGGPERDRDNLDPDGDGFVCGWSPLPYRALSGN